MVKWFSRLTLDLRVVGLSYSPDLLQKCGGGSISQLSVILDRKAKGITGCGHIEWKDQGRTA